MPRRGENIYKRKDGRWEARCIAFYDENGRAHYKSFYAKSYAEAKNKKQKSGLDDSGPVKTPTGVVCSFFDEACRQWLDSIQPNVKESTYVKYRNVLEKYVIGALGSCSLRRINAGALEQYFAELLAHGKTDGTGLSAKSVSDIKSVIKMVLNFAASQGWMRSFSIEHIVIKQDSRQIRVLTHEEQAELEKYLLTELSNVHTGIYLSLYTGIRIGELSALRWDDISVREKTISIKKTMLRIQDYSASAEKKTKIIETPPKSPCSIRTIPIPDFLLSLLRKKSAGMQGEEYLLTGKSGRCMEPRLMEYHFQKIVKALHIRHANFHCLRHTFATRCIEAGFDVKTLSVILGHASIQITMNRYVHPTMDMKRSNMEKLGQLARENQK